MKKLFIILLIGFLNINLFAQHFPFPPELKWWIFEIQSIDKNVKIENFKFSEKRSILNQDAPISYKNRLYPVLKNGITLETNLLIMIYTQVLKRIKVANIQFMENLTQLSEYLIKMKIYFS